MMDAGSKGVTLRWVMAKSNVCSRGHLVLDVTCWSVCGWDEKWSQAFSEIIKRTRQTLSNKDQHIIKFSWLQITGTNLLNSHSHLSPIRANVCFSTCRRHDHNSPFQSLSARVWAYVRSLRCIIIIITGIYCIKTYKSSEQMTICKCLDHSVSLEVVG